MRAWTNRTPRYEMHAADSLAFGSSGGNEEHETGRPDGGEIRPSDDPDWYLDLDNGEGRRARIAIW